MTGEEILNLVKFHSGDHQVGDFIQINRALRDYCQTTGFDWLRDVDDAGINFLTGETEYSLADFAMRRLNFVWVRGSTDARWHPVEEMPLLSFEQEVARNRNQDGTDDTNRPQRFSLAGGILRVTPTPDKNYDGRLDGIASSPVAERTRELPGPAEFHESVAILAAGFVLQALAKDKSVGAETEVDVVLAQNLRQEGNGLEQRARKMIDRAVRDGFPNRLFDLQPVKTPLMR